MREGCMRDRTPVIREMTSQVKPRSHHDSLQLGSFVDCITNLNIITSIQRWDSITIDFPITGKTSAARFTKYLTTILR